MKQAWAVETPVGIWIDEYAAAADLGTSRRRWVTMELREHGVTAKAKGRRRGLGSRRRDGQYGSGDG
jgi:hypothetical protein